MSPIRADQLARYPQDWAAISTAVKDAAGWRCECIGECGREHAYSFADDVTRCAAVHGGAAPGSGKRVVLTTAHLDHTPENCSQENLRAMCQACHLAYDRDHHAETRRSRRDG